VWATTRPSSRAASASAWRSRALVNRPALLLTDEPTGNLDSKNGEEVLRLFHDLNARGRTIVMVTHNPEIADVLPRVVELRDGQVLSDRVAAGA
jgi:putative ABC transport system ATP-binding protein